MRSVSPFRHFALSLFLLFTLDLAAQTTGREFWICIPPNEILPYPTDFLAVYVSATEDTEIEVTTPDGHTYKRKVAAGTTRELIDRNGETAWTWEIQEFEKVTHKGIHIRSTLPIAVSVLSSKVASNDGYSALPTSTWGQSYIVASYYDFREFRPWAGGFCVLASQPTTVKIALKGTGGEDGKTSGGRSINTGDTITVQLNAGDVYAVKGDAQTRGIFDLTGTSITSSAPVGVWGFHERTSMPNLLQNGNGRDHLVEMLPPVSAWGKVYPTVSLERARTSGAGQGDVFRVVASQNNTRWLVKSYDKATKKQISVSGGILSKAGDFADIQQTAAPAALTSGFSVWQADKPIFVAQYSTSASFDGDPNFDPFMVNSVPREQFTTRALCPLPTGEDFSKHYLTLVVDADTSDSNYTEDLKSLSVNGVPAWNASNIVGNGLLSNHMGGNLHYTTLAYTAADAAKPLVIKSNGQVRFGGYAVGYDPMITYGWVAAAAYIPSSPLDTMPPVITRDSLCGTHFVRATELRNIPDPPLAMPRDSDQVESGIRAIDSVAGSNTSNYRLVLITDQSFPRSPSYKTFDFRWEVVDLLKDAYCEFFVEDWYGNITLDTLAYTAPKLDASARSLDFGKLPIGAKDTLVVRLHNNDIMSIRLVETDVADGTYYGIIKGTIPPTVDLAPDAWHEIHVEYDARRASHNVAADLDLDTLIIRADCLTLEIPLSGVAAQAQIEVDDLDVGYVSPGEITCVPSGLRIRNIGNDTLIVNSITGYGNTSFSISHSAIAALPYRIAPAADYVMKDICYQRNSTGSDSIVVRFQSNAAGPKDTSIWRGSTAVVSVLESPLQNAEIELVNGTITASWQGASVSRIVVHDVAGQTIAATNVGADSERVDISVPALAHQQLFVSLIAADGTILHHKVLVVP